jgi:hypothetical protein
MRRFIGCITIAVFAILIPAADSQQPKKPLAAAAPRLDPVAETKLLMVGLAQANFDGLNRLLKDKPTDPKTWSFIRGQALLIAETGNLLMMRPPKNRAAQDTWMLRATELREAAVKVATSASETNFPDARAGVAAVANTCNRCHQSFQIATRVVPFEEARD